MKKFDYTFLENGLLPANFVNITNAISELKILEKARRDAYPDIFTNLEKIARVQSVKGSNEIEGIIASNERVQEIVNKNSAPLNHNEMEIAGYRDALNIVHTEYSRLDLSETVITGLHRTMLSYTPQDGGIYKSSDNVILEIDSQGNRRIRFSPISAKETQFAMEQMTLAYMEARDNDNINQLLLIPCVILDFLCIHPFSDGNERISRLLSLLLLYKNGFDAGKFISFEEQINLSKNRYCEALKLSSEGWHTDENSYFPFIENFIATLLMCYKELDKRFAVTHGGKVNKSQRIQATVLNSLIPISKKEICSYLPDVSPTTVETVLAGMLKAGSIKKIGTARNTKYIRKL